MYGIKGFKGDIEVVDKLVKSIKREIPKLIRRVSMGKYEIRRIYRVLRGLKFIDKRLYNRLLIETFNSLIKVQLTSDTDYKVYIGRYSPELDYRYIEVGENYLKEVEGGYPSVLNGGSLYISGIYPDIDSTAMALNIIIDASREMNIFDDRVDKALKNGLRYLGKRDLNKDGLLEQYPNEDWAIGVYREGSVLYSNALYLQTLENAFNLYIDRDAEYSIELQNRLLRCFESIEENLWFGEYYVDSISLRGGLVYRIGLDSSELGETILYSNHEKMEKHLKYIINNIEGLESRWALPIFSNVFKHNYKIFKEYQGYNGGVVPYYLAHFSRILIKYGLNSYSEAIIRYVMKNSEYLWIYNGNKRKCKLDGLDTKTEILSTLSLLSKKK